MRECGEVVLLENAPRSIFATPLDLAIVGRTLAIDYSLTNQPFHVNTIVSRDASEKFNFERIRSYAGALIFDATHPHYLQPC